MGNLCPALQSRVPFTDFTEQKRSLMLTWSRGGVHFSGLGGIWDGPSHGGNVCCGQTDQYSRSLLEEMEQRAKGASRLLSATSPCSQALGWYGVGSGPSAKLISTSVMAALMQKSSLRFYSNICCLQGHIFSRDVQALFKQTM